MNITSRRTMRLHRTPHLTTVVACLLVLAACVESSDISGNGDEPEESDIPACSAGSFFTVAPVEEGKYRALIPLGNLSPSAHTFPTPHIYYRFNRSSPDGPPIEASVRMPGDGWITTVRTAEHLWADPPYTDYALRFRPCRDYMVYFGHLKTLNDELEGLIADSAADVECMEYETGGSTYRNCDYAVEHFVEAGTVLGTAGRLGQPGIDWGARDFRRDPIQWGNQERIEAGAPEMQYTVCPVDAFEASVRSTLETRFGDPETGTSRTVEPVCGTIAQDVPGTAQGLWFREGISSVYPEDPHLALVHDNFDPTLGAVSMGTSVPGLRPNVNYFEPTHSGLDHREFSEVTSGDEVYCYSTIASEAILIRLESDTRLLVEHRSDLSCDGGPYTLTADATPFVR